MQETSDGRTLHREISLRLQGEGRNMEHANDVNQLANSRNKEWNS